MLNVKNDYQQSRLINESSQSTDTASTAMSESAMIVSGFFIILAQTLHIFLFLGTAHISHMQ